MNKEKNKETAGAGPADQTKKRLFKNAMKGNWDEVVKIYSNNPSIHKAKITRSGGTALHIAVSDGKEDIVKKLLNKIVDNSLTDAQEVLRMGDEIENTPLHTAAMLGNVMMCECIAEVDKTLIGARNKDSETPFFMAASHGHKHAFLCLHSLCGPGKGYDYSRRNNGETILHCAISGDYFDLAFQIIHHYKELVNSVNERGLSPLHLMATKPSAFRSGTYSVYCYVEGIFVDQLQVEKSDHYKSSKPNKDKDKSICPANYETCHYLIRLLLKGIKIVMHRATDCPFNNQGKPLASEAEDHPTQCSFDNEGNPIPILVAEDPPTQCSFDNEWKTIPDAENPCEGEEDDVSNSMFKAQGHQLFPPNYSVCFELVKLVSKAILVILGLGSNKIRKIREKKQNNTWSIQVMNELLKRVSMYNYENYGKNPLQPQYQPGVEDAFLEMPPITLAEDASEMSPIPPRSNISGANQHQQMAAEGPQDKNQTVFRKVDHEGNSALHLAARLGEVNSCLIPGGAAMLMQWEIKWYEFVMNSVPMDFFVPYNRASKSPKDVFTETHKALVKEGGEWLNKTSESCSVVATLITTVAFAASTTVPGGVKGESGKPTLENQNAFMVFAISSLVAFSFSVTAVIMFLAIITTWYQERDFRKDLPRKLLVGITSLFVSLASMLISFFAGHFFILRDKLNYITVVLYVVTCLPVALFTIGQFPLYFDVVLVTFSKVPRRSYKPTSTPIDTRVG
ncbi:hypothetical protein EZV62_010705 [Acer yangbiense]|uniref:PGG domain-containing protein n=1 Tax=Acer yangbiense TaxID=1000413 RepID=A0A5C7I383_9ROSI|nr:hypothetical protein EZV62_010705 [Acer yangbiense]